MADWFKFYENELDDERLQWAMTENRNVAYIYILLLTRCCREKSAAVEWPDGDIELLSLANKARLGAGETNQCLNLLERIGFISVSNGVLVATRWEGRQSDYIKRKERKECPNTVRTVSEHCPPRGEESRGDEKRGGTGKAPMFPSDMRKELDDLNAEIRAFKGRHLSVTASGNSWDSADNRQKHLEMVEQRDAIKANLRKMAASSSFTS